jgi:hypothetical protein
MTALVHPPANAAPAAVLRDVVLNGSGCSGAGSAAAVIAPDGDAVLVDYDALSANTSTGPAKQARSCTLVATLVAPSGHRVAVTGISATGDADLRAGARARLMVRHFEPGNPATSSASRWVVGPYRGATPMASSAPSSAWSWSGCGASQFIVVTASLFVDAGRGRAGGRAGINGVDLELATERCM